MNVQKGKPIKISERKFYKENLGHYYAKGLFLQSGNFYRKLYTFSLLVINSQAFYETMLISYEEEFSEFTEILHFTVLLVLSTLGIMVVDVHLFEKVIISFDDGLDDYEKTVDVEIKNEIQKIRDETDQRKKFGSKFMISGLYAATFSIAFLRPIYDYLSGKFSRPDLLKDNVNRYLPVMFWCPYFDVTTWYGQLYTTSFEYYVFLQTTFIVIASTVSYITICEELCYHISLLNLMLRNLKKRALYIGNGELKKEVLEDCLKRCIKHHNNIIECFKNYQVCFGKPLWLIVTISTYLICLAAYLISMEDIKLSHRITSILFLIFEIFHLLIYCAYGEEIQTLSSDTFYAIYDWDWIDCSISIKKYSLIIQARSITPLKLSCGGLMYANLNTFNNVCSSAYSYFNVLKASKSD